jgi:hypothetical protein
MFAESDDGQIYSRVPTIDELVKICKSLNKMTSITIYISTHPAFLFFLALRN